MVRGFHTLADQSEDVFELCKSIGEALCHSQHYREKQTVVTDVALEARGRFRHLSGSIKSIKSFLYSVTDYCTVVVVLVFFHHPM